MKDTDIRIVELAPHFTYVTAREPYQFGNQVMAELTHCHVRARVETRRGQVADGWGSIFLADFWAFPSEEVLHPERDAAMRRVVELFCEAGMASGMYAHPVGHFVALEAELRAAAATVSREMGLAAPLPDLAALVSGAPVDAAIHDAFGVVHSRSTYETYGPEFCANDLSVYLGHGFEGRYLSEYVEPRYAPEVYAFHSVGGFDVLREADVPANAVRDDLPNSLEKWVERDRLTCIKIKLRGNDVSRDIQRMLDVYAVVSETQRRCGISELYMSADPNEQCDSPEYMIEALTRVREQSPDAYDRILYVEQPTERDLRRRRHDMRKLAAMKPVQIDESLTALEDLSLAIELGWSGIALKTCKCHSMALLMAAFAETNGIPYTIQDLTNPGLALVHSVGLAARLRPLKGLETNSRQYFPGASVPERAVHPYIFRIRDGRLRTGSLQGAGFGYQVERIDRDVFQGR